VELEQQARRVIFASTQKNAIWRHEELVLTWSTSRSWPRRRQIQARCGLKAGEHRSGAQVQRQEEFWPSNFLRLLRFFYVRRWPQILHE
jgi:hypothetical protein